MSPNSESVARRQFPRVSTRSSREAFVTVIIGDRSAETAGQAMSYDFAYHVVPPSARRGPVMMGLLWLATQTNLAGMLVGFSMHQAGQSFGDLIRGAVIGFLGLCFYGVVAACLGAATGQMQPFLARAVFGKAGSILVSLLLLLVGGLWYSFQAVFTAQLLAGLFPAIPLAPVAFAVVLTALMAVNNLIGFKGIGQYGRAVAPIIIAVAAWIVATELGTVGHAAAAVSTGGDGVMGTAAAIIGVGVFGNEPDVWRFSRPGFGRVAPPAVIAYAVGLVLFPVAGWLMASGLSHGDPAQQAQAIRAVLFGSAAIAAIVILISQWAVNDINLYESVNAVTNVLNVPRYWSIAGLVVVGAALSAVMASHDIEEVVFLVTGICAATVPTATLLMAVDGFVVPRLFGIRRDVSRVASWEQLRGTNWLGIAALVVGLVVAVACSVPGTIVPGLGWRLGLAPVQGWIVAMLVYLGGVALVRHAGLSPALIGHAPRAGQIHPDTRPQEA